MSNAANNRPEWTTLREFLDVLETQGISTNVASFIGATTVRVHEVGYEDRAPTNDELQRMKALVRQAMEEGAMGIGTSLIYAPAFYASTQELIELSRVAAEYDGMYISHMRSEGNQLLEALEELITISREAGIRAEVYHLKAGGESNWHKMDLAIARIEEARASGLHITSRHVHLCRPEPRDSTHTCPHGFRKVDLERGVSDSWIPTSEPTSCKK